tara:strand:- start:704 stop:2323 length:1620 start_codon:yes stop_codon:yes gene_type:complete
MNWNEQDLQNALPVYLLSITWSGRVYRFSTYPLDLIDADGEPIEFVGELEDPEFSESADRGGLSSGGPSIPFDVVFPVDVAAEYAAGRPLNTATGELSMVFVRADGTINQTFENRYLLAAGYCEMPVYGYPTGPVGLASFTLEQPASDDASRLISSDAVITETTWPNATNDIGAVYPTVIGSPGTFYTSSGTAQTKPATPVYAVDYTGANADKLLVAGHEVIAAAVITIFDQDGASFTATPTSERDGLGRLVSTVSTSGAGGSFDKTSRKFYAAWPDNSGGLRDPLTGGLLTRLGDVCVWALNRSSIGADIARWMAARPLLNTVKLAGYIDDQDLSPWDFLRDDVFPLLPLEVQASPRGVIPLPRNLDRRASDVKTLVEAGPDFSADGPMTTISERIDLINHISIRFARDIADNSSRRTLTAQAAADLTDPDTFASPHSLFSQARYGERRTEITTDYIYDPASAGAVLNQRLRADCYPTITRTYRAAPRWGWLTVGDAVKLTDSSISITDQIVEIIGRRWDGDGWLYAVAFDEHPLRDA